jgi:FixJ family two-component response regulator
MNILSAHDARHTEPAGSPAGLVYVVDDDEAVRDSMRWLLEANGFEVRCFESAEAFLATDALREPVGCLVLDVRMPGLSGLALQDEMLRRGSSMPVIVVTGHGDVPMAVDTMKKGAVDFLQKPFSDERLCALVRDSLARAADSHRLALDARELEERMERLTTRERQVLERIVAGRLNKQIADDLGISIKTVEAHRANIMEKLLARSMAELMRIAIRARVGVAAEDH